MKKPPASRETGASTKLTLGESWSERIEQVFSSLQAPCPEAALIARLSRLLDLVAVWKDRVDLTAARTPDELADLYLADAVLLARAGSWPSGCRLLDVGAGGGAPGLVLASLLPEASVCLLEPREKRVAFLRTASGALGLHNVEVVRARCEDLTAKSVDVAVSRATLPPAEWLAEGTRLARRAVWVLLARAEPVRREGWSVHAELSYRWPFSRAARRALCYVPLAPAP